MLSRQLLACAHQNCTAGDIVYDLCGTYPTVTDDTTKCLYSFQGYQRHRIIFGSYENDVSVNKTLAKIVTFFTPAQ